MVSCPCSRPHLLRGGVFGTSLERSRSLENRLRVGPAKKPILLPVLIIVAALARLSGRKRLGAARREISAENDWFCRRNV